MSVADADRGLLAVLRRVRGTPAVIGSLLVVVVGFAAADNRADLLFQYLDNFAILVLTAIGLAIIFGIMGVINLAHGEFIMVGAFATSLAYANLPVPVVVAIVIGVLATVVLGVVVERLVVQWTYDRLLDSMVATWGLSLVLLEGSRILFGNTLPNPPNPLPASLQTITIERTVLFSVSLDSVELFSVLPLRWTLAVPQQSTSYSGWRLAMAGIAVVVLAAMYVLFTRTDYGMRARATIQDEETARAMGVDTDRIYTTTFAIGSGLAGLAGALLAPVLSIGPEMGQTYLVRSFVTVVVGGPSVVLGTSLSGGLLAGLDSVVTDFTTNTTLGLISTLFAAIVIIRVLPDGVTGFVGDLREELDAGGLFSRGGDR